MDSPKDSPKDTERAAQEPLSEREIAALRDIVAPKFLSVWGTTDGNTVTWTTTPDVSKRISVALNALPRLLDEVTRLRAEVASLRGVGADPCQRCGKLGGHPVDFRFNGILLGSWICPHCRDDDAKELKRLRAENAILRGYGYVATGVAWYLVDAE